MGTLCHWHLSKERFSHLFVQLMRYCTQQTFILMRTHHKHIVSAQVCRLSIDIRVKTNMCWGMKPKFFNIVSDANGLVWHNVWERQRHNVAIAINPLLELCCLSSSRTKAIHLWNLLWILFMLLDVLFISIPYGIIWCSKHQFNSNSRYTSQLTLTFWRIVRWFAHVLTFVLPFRWSIWFQSFKSDFWSKLLWFEYFRVWCWDFRGKF